LDVQMSDPTYDVADSPLSLDELSAGAALVYDDPLRAEVLGALKQVFADNARALREPNAPRPGDIVWFWPYELLAGVVVAVPSAATRVEAMVAEALARDSVAAAHWTESLAKARARTGTVT
jgi:hypothetical protein